MKPSRMVEMSELSKVSQLIPYSVGSTRNRVIDQHQWLVLCPELQVSERTDLEKPFSRWFYRHHFWARIEHKKVNDKTCE
jgi:hypothetical protein